VLNNLAMAHVMNGEPQKAEDLLRRVVANGSVPPKVTQNLALVLGLQGRYDEAKSYAVTSGGAEALKSDTDTIRQMVKLPAKTMPMAGTATVATNPATLNDAFRPGVVENVSAGPGGWQTKTAAAVTKAAAPAAAPGFGFKGTSR
jgi:hypothetical protein